MEDLDFGTIPFTDKAKLMIKRSFENYRRFGKIEIEMISRINFDLDEYLEVTITQTALINDKVLTSEELKERAHDIFIYLLPEGCELVILTNTYQI
jgi:hypothetical protein